MKQWKNLAEKDYLADIKPASKRGKGMAVEKITLYTDQNIGGLKAKIVEELPEVGEDAVLYLILKEESEEGNIYDEYIWVEKEEGEWGFEHIGATDKVEIILYDSTGQNTDGAMTQKAVTDALEGKADSSDVPSVVQTTGSSTTEVMSQDAVTSFVNGQVGNIDTALQALLNGGES